MRHLAIAFMVAVLPGTSFAWVAGNGLIVVERRDGFEVPYRGLSGAPDFWCAAGDYVVRKLGRAPGTKIYRTSSPPRRSGQGILFSLSPEGAKKPGLIVFSGSRGISAGHARELCNELRGESSE